MRYQSTNLTRTVTRAFGSVLFLLLAGCQSMSTSHTADCPEIATANEADSNSEYVIIGAVEEVALPDQKISLNARIDTGATTTSVNAQNIKKFERDGDKWVKFEIHNEKGKLVALEKPVSRVVHIKRHGTEGQDRYAVKLKLKLGNIEQLTELTLADRAKFTYPLLIGRNFLQDMAIVDVSKEYTAK